MRGIVLTVGSMLGGGFVLLGCLILIMGEAVVPARVDVQAFGLPAYAMGVAWLGLGVSLFCIGLLGAEVGAKYYVRKVRDLALLVFGGGFVAALVLVIVRVYGNVAL